MLQHRVSKTQEVRPDWNDKNDIEATYISLTITWKVLPMAQVTILKKYSIKCEKRFRLWIVYSELKRHNISHYIYYLTTDNIHIDIRKR